MRQAGLVALCQPGRRCRAEDPGARVAANALFVLLRFHVFLQAQPATNADFSQKCVTSHDTLNIHVSLHISILNTIHTEGSMSKHSGLVPCFPSLHFPL